MRKAQLLRFTLVALAAAGVPLAWSQNPPAQLTMEKVSPNIYVLTCKQPSLPRITWAAATPTGMR